MKRFMIVALLTFAVSTLTLSLLNCTATTSDNSNNANTHAPAANSNATAHNTTPTAANTAADEKALREIEEKWADAITRNDKAWLENMLHANYTWTSPEGTVNDKAKDIAEAADTKFDSLTISDEKVDI